MSAPFASNVRSYGESSRDSQIWSQTPSALMRYTAPRSGRRSSRGDPLPDPPPTSTIEIDVISADTDGTGARAGSGDVRSLVSDVVVGDPPDDDRPADPLRAAAYSAPLSSNRSERIS